MRSKQLLTIAVLLSFGISLLFFSSCTEDEEPIPDPATILLNPDLGDEQGEPGDVISTQVSVSAPAGLVSVTINKTVGDGSPSEYQTETPNAGENQLIFDFSYTLVAEEVGEIVTFDIIVEDEASATSAVKTFTVETTSPTARSYTAVLLYAPLVDESADAFFSSNTGATYSPDSVNATNDPLSADIDFGYYYGDTDEASLASPAAYANLPVAVFADQVSSWGTLNDTEFRSTTLGSSEFNELSTFADIDVVFEDGTTENNIITGLSVGDVIAFATDDTKDGGSKRGVILVVDIQGTFNENDYIELEVLVQEDAE